MRLFVYEHLMAGGFGPQARASLLAEGRAMLGAIAADFAAAGHSVTTILHERILDERAAIPLELPVDTTAASRISVTRVGNDESRAAAFARLAREADWSLVIAPEIGGQLIACCQAVLDAGGRLLGQSLAALAVTYDKHATADALRAAGVPTPSGMALSPGELPPRDFPFPAVLKPCDGAGSQDVLLMPARPNDWPRRTTPQRLERYCPGQATSVALLVGSRAAYALPACRQHLSDDGHFRYLGGSLPIEPELAARAERLARQAVAAVPGLFGYVGVDLVLGIDPSGLDDAVIEINPRLTTSYLGLRKLAAANLAAALLDVAQDQEPALGFRPAAVAFTAQGGAEMSG